MPARSRMTKPAKSIPAAGRPQNPICASCRSHISPDPLGSPFPLWEGIKLLSMTKRNGGTTQYGRIAIVTGGGSGYGARVVRRLIVEACNVATSVSVPAMTETRRVVKPRATGARGSNSQGLALNLRRCARPGSRHCHGSGLTDLALPRKGGRDGDGRNAPIPAVRLSRLA